MEFSGRNISSTLAKVFLGASCIAIIFRPTGSFPSLRPGRIYPTVDFFPARMLYARDAAILLFSEVTVPQYSASGFRDTVRMSQGVFMAVLERLEGLPEFSIEENAVGRPRVPAEKQLQATLWCLGTAELYHQVGGRCNLTKGACRGIVKRVVKALAINIAANIIQWPVGERATTVADGFRMKSHGFPGIVGAVDGCHIPIKRPTDDPVSYVNRKGFHSIILQAVCDHECLFTDVYAGWPGRVHDARVFRNSPLSEHLPTLPPDHHRIGDSAYPLTPSLMVPYKGALTPAQDSFNTKLSQARQCIERSFSLFKCRWRRMKYFDASDIEHMCNSIVACCVLHNLCILHNDSAADMMSNDDDGADG